MKKIKCSDFFWLVVINLFLLWVWTFFTAIDSKGIHKKFSEQISAIELLEQEKEKGKRNTFCDHLRHLVIEHGAEPSMLNKCAGTPVTDLEQIINLGY